MRGSHRDKIVRGGGGGVGGSRGLAKHSHFISQGSPFAPPPALIHPPSLPPCHLSLPLPPRSLGKPRRQQPLLRPDSAESTLASTARCQSLRQGRASDAERSRVAQFPPSVLYTFSS